MTSRKRRSAQKSTLLAFGVVAIASLSCLAQDTSAVSTLPSEASQIPQAGNAVNQEPLKVDETSDVVDHVAESTRAFRQAMHTLHTVTAHPSVHSRDASPNSYTSRAQQNSLLSALLPSAQGNGPFASAVRIAQRLRQRSWIPWPLPGKLGSSGRERSSSSRREEELEGRAVKVIDLLELSAELGNTDALFALAKLSLLPPTHHFPSNPARAYDAFSAHASATGNASAHAYLAFFHATGYHGVVPADQAKAQLYYTFAAHGGDRGAQTALGYRAWAGIGTVRDCARAVQWYENAAEQSMAKFLSGPPGGRTLPLTPTRLSDLDGGAYGPGSSVASTGGNANRPVIKAADARAAGETWEDLVEYYRFMAERGELDFALRLGKIFYQGSIYATQGGIGAGAEGVGAIPRDFGLAYRHFLSVARVLWPKDPLQNPLQHKTLAPVVKDDERPGGAWAVSATAYLGRMYLRGEGVKQNFALARMWFERGAEYGERECNNGLGIIWRDGLVDGRKDFKKAVGYFQVAAGQDLAEAQVNLGKLYYQRGDISSATKYFETALRHGSPYEAFYYLADLHARQAQTPGMHADLAAGSCATAVTFYKLVVERGAWGDDLLAEAERAWNSGTDAGADSAMLLWWMAAERGNEFAQNNLAYVLDQDKSLLRLTRFAPLTPSNDTARVALMQWTRSSAQQNVDALVKVGDYYYHGLGVPDEPEAVRWEKAAGYYLSAAETHMSALAMWNMGWMYENGVGVPQDFHLAKRYYDLALDTNSEAYLPVMLSLVKLYARSIWHTICGGTDGLSLWPYGDEDSFGEYDQEPREIEGGNGRSERPSERERDDRYHAEPEEDGPWYYGKAREQLDRRRRGEDVYEDDDPVEYARNYRAAEAEDDDDFGPEDYFDGAIRGHRRVAHRGNEIVDIALIFALLGLLALLLWIRGRLIERMQRHEEGEPLQQGQNGGAAGDNGLFPPLDDPARQDWAILR